MVTFLLFTAWAFSAGDPLSCQESFGHLRLPLTRLASAVESDAVLTAKVRELMESEDIPLSLKKIVYDAIERQYTKVFQVAEQRSERASGRYFYNRQFATKLNSATQEVETFTVFDKSFLPEGPENQRQTSITLDFNHPLASPEESLIHELAHIRFLSFLDRRFKSLVERGKVPPWAWVRYQGNYALLSTFYNYLAERYAYETQFQLVKAKALKGIDWHNRTHPLFGNVLAQTDESLRAGITSRLQRVYQAFRDPRFRPFDSLTLSQILQLD